MAMVPFAWKLGVLTLIFMKYPVKCDQCTISNLDKVDGYCTAQIDCQKYVDFDVNTWDCIKHTKYHEGSYDYYDNYIRGYEETTYDDNYFLIINVTEFMPASLSSEKIEHVIKLILENGDLWTIPEDVYKMTRLKEILITKNKISTVNFNNFLPMLALSKIILKDNMISLIDMNEETNTPSSSKLSNVKIIDVSLNFIEILPDNFLSHFNQLQHLNLSHNKIQSIGVLSFEGMVQLETLDISNNELLAIGNAFVRFANLKELIISNNNISKLFDYNFVALTNLEKLNGSYNDIATIENNTFQSLNKLKVVDLGHNKLEKISKYLFESNTNLQSLSLLDNRIQSIEESSFKNMHITEFSIQSNFLSGAIGKDTFKGIDVDDLNLSGGNITSIKAETFTDMLNLNNLNLSSNTISNISYLAFSSLVSLNILDLSHNELNELYFDSYSLKNLSQLYAHHNNIQNITKAVFNNFISLKELDLSYNDIKEIEPQSFLNLDNTKTLTVKGSHFVMTLESKALEGLTSLQKIDLSETRTTLFQNESFLGLISLTHINASYGQLTEIEYNAFTGANSLEILILSNNQLRCFHVNTSTISHIKDIRLNNNFLTGVSNETFFHLTSLLNLNLNDNNILKISSDAFKYLYSITYLDLSSNTRMEIIGNPFHNLSKLYSLSMQNVKTKITFVNSSASIEVLNIQFCGINDVNEIGIFNVQVLSYLNLSMNEITAINKDSFRNMPFLVSLDLSLNKIMSIQPGSFMHVQNLKILNLFGNSLPSIQFGAFDGIVGFKGLNLSRNVLQTFDIKLVPGVSTLSLDDNIITHLNFEDFFNSKIVELSIGGNQISCKVLADLKVSNYSEKFKSIVTANTLNYHSENVNGISCQTAATANDADTVFRTQSNPSININPFISSLRDVLANLNKSFQTIGESTSKTDELRVEARNVIKTLEDLIESINKNQVTNNEQLNKLTGINNDSNVQLVEIKKYLKYLTELKNEPDSTSKTKNPLDDQYMRLEFQKMLNQETDALRAEFKMALAGFSIGTPNHEPLTAHDRDSNNTKAVFYFIAICLTVMLAVYLGNIVFSHVTRRRSCSSRTRNSATPISNSIEMLE